MEYTRDIFGSSYTTPSDDEKANLFLLQMVTFENVTFSKKDSPREAWHLTH